MKFSSFLCSWIAPIALIFCIGCATNSRDETEVGKSTGDTSLSDATEPVLPEPKRREALGTEHVVQPVLPEVKRLEVGGTKHIIQAGDTVAKLSKQYYNEINRESIQRIVDANPGVRFPRPKVGVEVTIPPS